MTDRTALGNLRLADREIIVKFATYRARQKVIRNRSSLKTSGHKDVFVNEDLTRYRSNVLYEARKLVKSKKLASAWSSDGNLLIKIEKDDPTTIHRIQSAEDLNSFRV